MDIIYILRLKKNYKATIFAVTCRHFLWWSPNLSCLNPSLIGSFIMRCWSTYIHLRLRWKKNNGNGMKLATKTHHKSVCVNPFFDGILVFWLVKSPFCLVFYSSVNLNVLCFHWNPRNSPKSMNPCSGKLVCEIVIFCERCELWLKKMPWENHWPLFFGVYKSPRMDW